MKKIILLLFVTSNIFAQQKTTKISEKQIGQIECSYENVINYDDKTQHNVIYVGFQNYEYKQIVDRKSIVFIASSDTAKVLEFVKDLNSALLEMGKKTQISWDKESYSIALYDFSDNMYLSEAKNNGKGYTLVSKKQVLKIIEWFNSIGFK